jgi:hypothetical protein
LPLLIFILASPSVNPAGPQLGSSAGFNFSRRFACCAMAALSLLKSFDLLPLQGEAGIALESSD